MGTGHSLYLLSRDVGGRLRVVRRWGSYSWSPGLALHEARMYDKAALTDWWIVAADNAHDAKRLAFGDDDGFEDRGGFHSILGEVVSTSSPEGT